MALIVEDGTGLATAQSYISAADASTYHTAHGNTAWTGTDAVKEAALVRATAWLDGRYLSRWPGVRYTSTQALEWPRAGAVDCDGNELSAMVPAALKNALCEAALKELVKAGSLSEPDNGNGAIIAETEGGMSRTYARGVPPVSPAIFGMLGRILRPAGIKVVRA